MGDYHVMDIYIYVLHTIVYIISYNIHINNSTKIAARNRWDRWKPGKHRVTMGKYHPGSQHAYLRGGDEQT